MDIDKLKVFLTKAANSQNVLLQQSATGIQNQLLQSQEDDDVVDADVQKEHPEQANTNLELEDVILQRALPEMQLPDPDDSTFGKVSKVVTYWQLLGDNIKVKKASNNLMSVIKRRYAKGVNCR